MEHPIRTLLLVEDEAIVAMAEAQSLKNEGYNVIVAYHGADALEAVRSSLHDIDLVLMDINLGNEEDGTDTAQEILRYKDIPVVFLSSHTEKDIVEKTEKITSYGYVVKNTGITVLSASIKMAFKLHDANRELKKKEEALKESEEKFRRIFDQSPVGACITSTDYFFKSVNPEMCRMLGYSENEFFSLRFSDITHPDHIGKDTEQIHRLEAGEIDQYTAEKRYVRKDGTIMWGQLSLRSVRDASGRLLFFLPMIIDITERKLAEEKLAESELQYRTLVEALPEGITVTGIDMRMNFVSLKSQKLFGLDGPEDAIGRSPIEFIAPEDRDRAAANIKLLMKDNWTSANEYTLLKKDGTLFDAEIHSSLMTDAAGNPKEVITIIRDITDRKKTERALQESETITRNIINNLPLGIHQYRLDADGRLIFEGANPTADRILGIDHTRFIGMTIEEAFPNLSGTEVPKRYRQACASGTPWQIDRITYEDMRVKGAFEVYAFQTEPGRMAALFADITGRKRTEMALRESENRFRTLVDSSEDVIYTLDMGRRISGIHGKALKRAGVSSEKYLGKTPREIVGAENASEHESAYMRALSGEYVIYDWTIKGDSGTRYYQSSLSPIFGVDNKVTGIVGIAREVTGLRRTDERMRVLYELIDIAPASITMHDFDGNFIYANRRTFELHGYSRDEFFSLNLRDLDIPESSRLIDSRMKQLKETGEASFEAGHYRKDGSILPLALLTKIAEWEGKKIVLSIGMDISERRRADEQIRLVNERLQFLLFSTSAVLYSARTSVDYGATYISKNVVRLTGYTPEQFVEDPGFWIEHVHPDDRERVLNELLALLEKDTYTYEYRFHCQDGSYIWMRDEMRLVRDPDGKPLEIIGFWMDLTKQKQVQEALQESEEHYRRLLDSVSDYVYTVKIEDGRPVGTTHGPGCLAVTGHSQADYEADPYLWYRMIYDHDREAVAAHSADVIAGRAAAFLEHRIVHRDGSIRWVRNTSVPHYDDQHALLSYDSVIEDITERKRSVDMVRESEEKFSKAFHLTPLSTVISSMPEGKYVDVNESFVSFTGFSREQVFGRTSLDIKLWVNPEQRKAIREQLNASGIARNIPVKLRIASGALRDCLYWATTVDINNRPYLIAQVLDVTESRHAEEALRKSEAFLNNIIDQSPLPIWISDDKGVLIRINKACCDMLHISPEEVLGKYNILHDNIVKKRGALRLVKKVYDSGDVARFEIAYDSSMLKRLVLSDKAFVILETTVFPIMDAGGHVTNAVIQHVDITERKRAAEVLEKSIREKEILLKELQHRVKNNLNVISSLLGLEQDKLPDEASRRIFIDAQSRIRSMSGIYEQLHRSTSLDSVQLNVYIKDLAESLFQTYAMEAGKARIMTSLAEVTLEIKRAVPIGLILNELITNALKHAFPKNKKGIIRIGLKMSGNSVELKVSDNGVGLPKRFDPETVDTMGLRLVRMLTDQINGKMKITGAQGTTISVKFTL